jgi:hypothetical protein
LSVAGGIAPYGGTKKCYLVMEWNGDQKKKFKKNAFHCFDGLLFCFS